MTKEAGTRERFATPNWRAFTGVLLYMLELKHPYTRGHSHDVQSLAKHMGRAVAKKHPLEWNAYQLECLSYAALFHDVGKTLIDIEVLDNENPALTPEQIKKLRPHPLIGSDIVGKLLPADEIVQGIQHHHARWDGLGYPDGEDAKAGLAIPAIARIIAICDAFDAMTTKRSYNHPVTIEESARIILENAGTQFDPEYAKIFVEEVIPHL